MSPESPLPPPSPAPLPYVAGTPVRVVIENGSGWLGRWGSRLGWILFGVTLLWLLAVRSSYDKYTQTNPRIEERLYSHNADANAKVAIITVDGVIMHTDGYVKWQIEQAKRDPDVKAVVLRVDSPGGTVTGSHYIYHQLIQLTEEKKIPLVVSMGGIAASGGYYIAMATQGKNPDVIYAEPTTWTGSIGVIIPHYDVSDLLEKWSIKDDSVVSHPLKQMLSPTHKPTPEVKEEERKIVQALVDDSFESFKAIVKGGRPNLTDAELKEVATGQVFTANQALNNKLVDKIGFLDDAVERAIVLAKLKPNDVRAIKYSKPSGLFASLDALTGEAQTDGAHADVAALLNLATPRAYYLFTWPIAGMSSAR